MGKPTAKGAFDMMSFAARLKDLMREQKLTQKDLAKALGIAPNMVSAYICGKSCPSLPIAVKTARYFGVSLDFITCLTDQRQQPAAAPKPKPTPKPEPKRQRNDPWRKMAICNSCDWRRRLSAPCGDWDGTACMYTHETGIFRAAPPTDEHCDYYKSKTALAGNDSLGGCEK